MNKKELYKVIGKNIKKYRNEYSKKYIKITQENLAEIINVSPSLISSLESSKTQKGLSIYTLYCISKVLNVSIDDLIKKD